MTKCLNVDVEARPSIEDILADPYLQDCPESFPALSDEEQKLRVFIDDVIKRSNVHEFEGREAFEKRFAEQVSSSSAGGSTIDLDANLLEHYRQLAVMFLFNEDPDKDELEAEKDLVLEESKAAYAKSAERMAKNEANHPLQDHSSSSSDEENDTTKKESGEEKENGEE